MVRVNVADVIVSISGVVPASRSCDGVCSCVRLRLQESFVAGDDGSGEIERGCCAIIGILAIPLGGSSRAPRNNGR